LAICKDESMPRNWKNKGFKCSDKKDYIKKRKGDICKDKSQWVKNQYCALTCGSLGPEFAYGTCALPL
jgi:hypothetical protein